MARENNFLLGYGERLTKNVKIPKGSGPKNPPYTHDAAINRIGSQLARATDYYKTLPTDACPGDEVTAIVTMHPRYISKSDFPSQLLQQVGLRAVGGRTKVVKPDEWGVKQHPDEAISDEIFVVGKRTAYEVWSNEIFKWTEKVPVSELLPTIEGITPYKEDDKVIVSQLDNSSVLFEVVLHEGGNERVLNAFDRFAKINNCQMVTEKIRQVQELIFVPVYADSTSIKELAKFSFVRVIRKMPSLRALSPLFRKEMDLKVKLPISLPALDQNIRTVIFDGGIPNTIKLPWVNEVNIPGIGPKMPGSDGHGLDVTSAFLFGPIDIDYQVTPPICNVDHIRVIDQATGSNGDFMYYDVLDRITEALDSANPKYEFCNLSLGPDIPIDDNDITRWTAELDLRFSGGTTLAAVAAGNNGDSDASCGLNRIQPPSDGVNILAVGAANRDDENWKRAYYSCIGPGRCPGFVKPDGIAFGGSPSSNFLTISTNEGGAMYSVAGTMGTSFASPYALKTAVSVKAYLGEYFSPLSIKALLIHRANNEDQDPREVGWGKFETDIGKLITCDDDEALVVFQGALPMKEHLRVPIPLPAEKLKGMVCITTTLVIAPEIDASFPNTYTRAGLSVTFRPDSEKFKIDDAGKIGSQPDTKSFFSISDVFKAPEYILRDDGHKWETCLKATKRFRADTLNAPFFDVYYNNRYEGCADKKAQPIPYAFIISVKAPKVTDLYNRTVRTYANQLVTIRPKLQIQQKLTM